jgi:hypothetical protein
VLVTDHSGKHTHNSKKGEETLILSQVQHKMPGSAVPSWSSPKIKEGFQRPHATRIIQFSLSFKSKDQASFAPGTQCLSNAI